MGFPFPNPCSVSVRKTPGIFIFRKRKPAGNGGLLFMDDPKGEKYEKT